MLERKIDKNEFAIGKRDKEDKGYVNECKHNEQQSKLQTVL